MANSKESYRKNLPSSQSLNDIMKLFMKLNEKIRQKLYPTVERKKEAEPGRLDLVIMILLPEEARTRAAKRPKAPRAEAPKGEWIERLCADIEKGSPHRK